jgi:DNA mismatch endonuclease (patch repair protein)
MPDSPRRRSSVVTSRIMSAVRSKDTACELALRREIWRRGLRYRLHARRSGGTPLPGCPDLVFSSARVAVFIDGDFWHGRTLLREGAEAFARRFQPDKRDFWLGKIERTMERDRKTTAELEANGWTVVRLWESDTLRSPPSAADRVSEAIGCGGGTAASSRKASRSSGSRASAPAARRTASQT